MKMTKSQEIRQLAKLFRKASKPPTVPSTDTDSEKQKTPDMSETYKYNTMSAGTQGASTNPTISNQTQTHGSSSTTQPTKTSPVAKVSKAKYDLTHSFNKLTQGQARGKSTSAPTNLSQVNKANYHNTKAQPTQVGIQPPVQPPTVNWSNAPPSSYVYVTQTYGADLAQRFFMQSYSSPQQTVFKPATLEQSSFIPNQKPTIRQAGERQKKYVDSNKFQTNPPKHVDSVVPTKVTRRVRLTQGLGVKENPLSILEGDKFLVPANQYLTQVNTTIAKRPTYQAFTSTAYTGVKKQSPMTDLSSDKTNQNMGLADYWHQAKEHSLFPFAIVIIIFIAVMSLSRGQ